LRFTAGTAAGQAMMSWWLVNLAKPIVRLVLDWLSARRRVERQVSNSDWNGYSPDFGNHLSYDTTATQPGTDGMPYSGNVGIGPYTAIILSQG